MQGLYYLVSNCYQAFHQRFIRPIQVVSRAYLGDVLYDYTCDRLKEIVVTRMVGALFA